MKDLSELYKVGTWAGFDNFECIYCPYATLDEDLAREHALKHWIAQQQGAVLKPMIPPAAPGPLRTLPREVTDGSREASREQGPREETPPFQAPPAPLETLDSTENDHDTHSDNA